MTSPRAMIMMVQKMSAQIGNFFCILANDYIIQSLSCLINFPGIALT